jgi:hypothetical protein
MATSYYKSGSWNFICEVCGQQYKAEQMRKRWDGVITCPNDWEPRHPQDFVRGVKDNQSVPISRPEPPDQFIPLCTLPGSCGVVGLATVGCSKVGKPQPIGF